MGEWKRIWISSEQEFKRCDTGEVVNATQIGFPGAVPVDIDRNGGYKDLEERVRLFFSTVEVRRPNAYMLGEPYSFRDRKNKGRVVQSVFPVTYYIITGSSQEKL